MSTDPTDTTSDASDADAFVSATESVKESSNEKVVEITQAELDSLAALLDSYRNILIGHEERLLEHEGRITTLEQKKPVKLEIPRGRSR